MHAKHAISRELWRALSSQLRLLDGSEVSRAEREFILQMHIRRCVRMLRHSGR